MKEYHEYIVSKEESGIRIDVFLVNKETNFSRSFIQRAISEGYITANGSLVKPNYKVREGDLVSVNLPEIKKDEIPLAEDIPLDIVFEDDEILVVNKPAGMVVHPAAGIDSGTLVNAILSRLTTEEDMLDDEVSDLTSISPQRPGIVHRIDKGTSGLLVVAKTMNAYYNLSAQFSEHSINRKYIAVVCGTPKQEKGTIIAPIGRNRHDRKKMSVTPINSREAITHFNVLEYYDKFSLVEVKLETGRTHQIRVHFSYIGHPIVGDPDYGGQKRALKTQAPPIVETAIRKLNRQALHAQVLGFMHPSTGKYIEFSSQVPEDIQCLIDALRYVTQMEVM